jgi:hypothetical protein
MTPAPTPAAWRTWRIWVMVTLALGLTFWAYLQPDLIVDLATRAWSCF